MKKTILIIMVIGFTIFGAACGSARSADHGMRAFMEASAADWVKTIEKDCMITGFGRPFGTVKETLHKDGEQMVWRVTFEIDEDMSQAIVDGYAKAVWDACVEADGGRMHSCNGYLYDDAADARRSQVPLNYYIWYYTVGHKEFRVGVYPTNMEDGIPGGVVLKIERWNYVEKGLSLKA